MNLATIPEWDDALRRGSAALFIGADLPEAATGLPSRADLAREMARRKGLDPSLSLAAVAQRVGQGGNRWEFSAYLREALDTVDKAPRTFHRRIVAWVQAYRLSTIITTAYDDLLELAFDQAGVALNRVVRDTDLTFAVAGRPLLIKLYGDAQRPDTLLVTEDDHYGLWRSREKEDVLDEVRATLRTNTLLFLGYNLSDPDFHLL